MKFPRDAPLSKVLKALEALGFEIVREGNHISMSRLNPDGSRTPLTLPNHGGDQGFYAFIDIEAGRNKKR